MQQSTKQFLEDLKKHLVEPLCLSKDNTYVDLATNQRIEFDLLSVDENYLPPNDPLIQVLAIILQTMQEGPFEFTRLGVNELLKSYLRRVNTDNEQSCTLCYLECIYQLSLYGLLENYPYTNFFWDYLCKCFDTISKYLIEYSLVFACQVFLYKVSVMAKDAAQKNLHTSSIQHLLHNIEIWARAEGYYELADDAKNKRFNLETVWV
ncbi:MAG: hypothetical protein CVU87_01590 [Firmicutes bacterium HGW-Firmicutes-12]|jgi:hypothetical protein|nr:MAG: hypothetical protein CVU87_01590 [Firmicutes bacterium HGW-Firmicutes-12]